MKKRLRGILAAGSLFVLVIVVSPAAFGGSEQSPIRNLDPSGICEKATIVVSDGDTAKGTPGDDVVLLEGGVYESGGGTDIICDSEGPEATIVDK